jgi:hypothetical protein
VCGNGKDGYAASVCVIKTIDQMKIAWAATSCADSQLARQSRFGSGRECGGLFVPEAHPFDPIPPSYGIRNPIQGVARYSIDSLGACGGKDLHK